MRLEKTLAVALLAVTSSCAAMFTGTTAPVVLFTPGWGIVGFIVDGSTAAWYTPNPLSHVTFREDVVQP